MKRSLLIVLLCATAALAQRNVGSLKGSVTDEFGSVIVGAAVVATDANGATKTATTTNDGNFTLSGLAPGKYDVKVSAQGFANFENAEVAVTAGAAQKFDVTLKVTIEQQKVTVSADAAGVNTDPENNVGAIVLKGTDLESLPDDPDDLAAALQALAGPAAGPNGGQIYIDGFSGGRLPPLSSIREIRINANPFSAEYDRPGSGRIEILTKPGTDRFRGQVGFNFNNQALNSRNPFAPTRAPYMSRNLSGNVSGPITRKKASFFIDFEKRDTDDRAVINATVLDPTFAIVPFAATVATPRRNWDMSPRLDYQLNANNTIVARYEYEKSQNLTIPGLPYSLPSRIYKTFTTQQTARLTETAILNKRTVNETRFQFNHQTTGDTANNSIPTVSVQEAFTGGGSQIGLAANKQNRFEITNITSMLLGAHNIKFGARARTVSITSISPQNFGGTWTFSGTRNLANPEGLTSIQAYQITQQGLQQGLSGAQIRLLGGGATQFSITAGDPEAKVSQFDFGGFAQDDWKYRPNLTISVGLRYENQTNIHSNLNFAPRIGVAWAPGSSAQPKTTIRAGFGFFYDRIGENLTLNTIRFNGINQQQFTVTNLAVLNSFPNVPSIDSLEAFKTPVSIYSLANNIEAPYSIQSIVSVERALPHNFRSSVTFSHTRTLHMLRARALNAPLPGTFIPNVPGSGTRPLGVNNYFEYDSSGVFNQNLLIFTLGGNISRKISFNANYAFGKANSDTDGSGTFAANPYDFTDEYGRTSNDVRHRFTLNGSFRAPWGLSFNPLLVITSGTPFNITIGRDLNGDVLFTDRPALATDLTKPGVIITKFGAFDTNPAAGATIIPRNYGQGPGAIISNLRISKTFGFGGERRSTAQNRGQQNGQGNAEGQRGGAGGRGGFGGAAARGAGGGGGGAGGGGQRGGGAGGGRGGFGGGEAGQRYNLTFSVNFQNVLNHVNLGRPVGNLSSSIFGQSNSSSGGFGGFGGRGGGGSAPFNRLIELQVRFTF
ncbi:MAG TPA: carboxypeptidase regulatory-like domain-containing protein [Pyrinomonadaceae bacterium]|nr:carboxypeptidase regulatory-like domain-containing protein [Pyrinomonadaceae bacterium]